MTRRYRHRIIIAGVASSLLGLAVFGTTRLERPIADYFLFDYTAISSIQDAATGKFVQLGVMANFGSFAYEVGVYDSPSESKSRFRLRKPVISLIPHSDLTLQFDGQCYFVKSSLRREWDKIEPLWRDKKSGKEICFYVLTPDDKKITRTEDIPKTRGASGAI